MAYPTMAYSTENSVLLAEITVDLFDLPEALERVGGDAGLLREIAVLFLDTYSEQIQEIDVAISRGNAADLECSAHGLKGAVSTFSCHAATQAAYALEVAGHSRDLEKAPRLLQHLQAELARLHPVLQQFVQG